MSNMVATMNKKTYRLFDMESPEGSSSISTAVTLKDGGIFMVKPSRKAFESYADWVNEIGKMTGKVSFGVTENSVKKPDEYLYDAPSAPPSTPPRKKLKRAVPGAPKKVKPLFDLITIRGIARKYSLNHNIREKPSLREEYNILNGVTPKYYDSDLYLSNWNERRIRIRELELIKRVQPSRFERKTLKKDWANARIFVQHGENLLPLIFNEELNGFCVNGLENKEVVKSFAELGLVHPKLFVMDKSAGYALIAQ